MANLLTILTLLHLVLTPGAWHLSIEQAERPERVTVVTATAEPRSSITPAREHPHHSPAVHTCPGATAATSHRAAGPATGSPAGLILAVIPSVTPLAPAQGPATTHDDNFQPRAMLPHLLRC